MDDTQNSNKNFQIRDQDIERRKRLSKLSTAQNDYNPRYSDFIRRAKLVLPLIAMAIVAVVFTWSHMSDEAVIQPKDKTQMPKTIGKNELLNPRFESTDDKKQPYTITASQAVQSKNNEDLVLLQKPLADMLLNSGNWVAIEANQGTFMQNTQKLKLDGDVRLFHDEGYQMKTQELYIDLNNNTAWSEQDVSGQGPDATLKAKGVEAFSSAEHIVFKGPAKLVLQRSVSKHSAGDL